MQAVYSQLVQELHRSAKTENAVRASLALSGGLDSVVTLCLAVRAFGARNVFVLSLPENGVTTQDDLQAARLIAQHYGCPFYEQSINNFISDYRFISWDKPELSLLKAKARTRNTLLHHFAETQGAMIISSANKSDLALGFGQIDGAFSGKILPLGDLYKTEVHALGEFIGLPEEILKKAPTRGLQSGVNDEQELGAPWSILDHMLEHFASKHDPEELIQTGLDSHFVHRIARMIEAADPELKHVSVLPKESTGSSIKKAQAAEASS